MKPVYCDMDSRAIADVHEYDFDGWYRIARINVPPKARGKGIGTRLLAQVCQDADAEGVVLVLEPSASPVRLCGQTYGLNQAQLVAWYERHGFEPCTYEGLPLPYKPHPTAVYYMQRQPRTEGGQANA